jgi:hypothetical protein
MKEVQFGTDGDRPCNMFIVHEAEAQAIKALDDISNELEVEFESSLLTEPSKTPGSAGRLSFSSIAEVEPLTSVSTVLLPLSPCASAQKYTKLWVGAQPASSRYVWLTSNRGHGWRMRPQRQVAKPCQDRTSRRTVPRNRRMHYRRHNYERSHAYVRKHYQAYFPVQQCHCKLWFPCAWSEGKPP